MSHKPLSQLFMACIAAVALSAATLHAAHFSTFLEPNSTESFVLADLINNQGGFTVGDKTFSEFFYSTLPGDDMPAPEDINVFGFQDVNGNFGVSFQGAFLDLPGGGSSDALLRFTVEVHPDAAAEGFRISDAHLFMGGAGLGDDSFIAVDETFQQVPNAALNAFASTLNGPEELQLADWVFFDGLHTKLRVTKDILAIAGDASNQPARTTVIDQSFSQVRIPEPTTFALLGLALVGIAAGRRQV